MDYEKKYKELVGKIKKAYLYAQTDSTKAVLGHILPELKEEFEDDKVRKEIIDYIKNSTCQVGDETYKSWLAWLEKQSEKLQYWKPSEEQFEALDYAYNSCPDTERGNYYEGVLETLIDDLHKLLKNQGEQKPADKVEPKFKVGDWITNGEYTWEVILVSYIDYTLQNQLGECVEDTIDFVDKNFHLWTIQDANDGDILAAHNCVVLF